jgi:hypothetical protein
MGQRDGRILLGRVYGHMADDQYKAQATSVDFALVENQN